MTKAQKELVEEKEILDRRLKDITGYFKPEDYRKAKGDEPTELSAQYAELSARQKELEKQIAEFPKKEK